MAALINTQLPVVWCVAALINTQLPVGCGRWWWGGEPFPTVSRHLKSSITPNFHSKVQVWVPTRPVPTFKNEWHFLKAGIFLWHTLARMRRFLLLLLVMALSIVIIPEASAKAHHAKPAKHSATAKSTKHAKAQKAGKSKRAKSAGTSKAKRGHRNLV